MSLTSTDLNEIRTIVYEEVRDEVGRQLSPIQNELQTLRNDIREIYDMIAGLQRKPVAEKDFDKLPIEKKTLELNSKLIIAANQSGITLPR